MTIIDTPWRTTAILPKLKSAGVSAIVRYYNRKNSTKLPEKRMEPEEAVAIDAAGMDLCAVYQQGQDEIGDFTYDQGHDAGKRAFIYADTVIKQPRSSAIYFSVDADFDKTSQLAAVDSFFTGIRDAFADQAGTSASYTVGAYGSGRVLGHLKGNGLAMMFWLAQSMGWSDYKKFKDSGDWHLLQGPVTKIAGLDCDTDEANPTVPSYGQFRLGPAPRHLEEAVVVLMTANARDGLNLRQGPGTSFAVLKTLPFGTPVHVRGRDGNWSLIDLEGDGKLDGYCFSSFLTASAWSEAAVPG